MFRTILFAAFAASATAFTTTSPAFVRPTLAPTTPLGMSVGSHGADGHKKKHDMEKTSSTDSQDEIRDKRELNTPENIVETAGEAIDMAEEAAEEAIETAEEAIEDAANKAKKGN